MFATKLHIRLKKSETSPDSGDASVHVPVAKGPPLWLQRLPNQLTFLRIAAIPLVVVLMQTAETVTPGISVTPTVTDIFAAVIFGAAAVTDFLDGWIARKFGVETVLGKLLDPLADKLLDVSAMIILVEKHRLAGWVAVILIVRDLGINAIRIAAIEDNVMIHSSWIGKTKTALLDISIVGLIVYGPVFEVLPFRELGNIFMGLAVFASVTSAILYLVDYAKELKKKNPKRVS